jgi:predicted small secreted protein
MIRILLTAAIAAAIGMLSACNTMQGLGEDIERGGEKLQDKADR